MTEPVYGDARLKEAVAWLRALARDGTGEVPRAIKLLDQAGIFDPIDKTTAVDVEDPCRCGHSKGDHSSTFADPQCRLCPEDGEKMWRHPHVPQSPVVASFPAGPDGQTGNIHADGSYSEYDPNDTTP